MAVNKTQENDASVDEFIAGVGNDRRRRDSETVLELMRDLTGVEPKMWGTSIVGFGKRHMVYESGRELDWFWVGFSPRKQSLTLYIMDGFDGYAEKLARLGTHTTGKSCLYIKNLDDIDPDALRELVAASVKAVKAL